MNNSISCARMISMIMIFLCHILQYYNNWFAWWLNVGVYSFIAISGLLYGEKEINDSASFLARRMKKILIPYWLYLPFAFSSIWLISGSLDIKNSVGMFFLTSTVTGLNHLWYMRYVMICYIITPLLCEFKKYVNNHLYSKMLSWIILCATLQIICSMGFPSFRMSVINTYIASFALSGILIQRQSKYGRLISLFLICLSLFFNVLKIVCICRHYTFPGYHLFSDYCHMTLGLAILDFCLVLFRNVKYNCLLNFSDKHSYSIYICHHLLILGPLSLMSLTQYAALNITLILIITLISAMILTQYSNWIIKHL